MANGLINFTDADRQQFLENGYIKLPALFDTALVAELKKLVDDQISSPKDSYGKGFSRFGYDVGNDYPFIREMLQQDNLKKTLARLIPERLLFTQGVGFELEKKKSTGFAWHYELVSFNYIRPSDHAFSLWLPLDPIDASVEEHGGMCYAPVSKMSGIEDLKQLHQMSLMVSRNVDQVAFDFANWEAGFQANTNLRNSILEGIREQDSFQPGDAFLFNRYVWHRSVTLGGPERRKAFVFRFVSIDARFDRSFLENLDNLFKVLGRGMVTNFGYSLGLDDQQPIVQSPKVNIIL